MSNQMTPTTIGQLKSYVGGEVVELPGWVSDQPFYCRLTHPSLLKMASNGEIPNSLLTSASNLFKGSGTKKGKTSSDSGDRVSEMYDTLVTIAKASMAEPSYEELEEAGIELTDQQLMEIFSYSQNGVNSLKSFRGKQGDSQAGGNVALL